METLQLASGIDLARTKVPSPAMSLLKLSGAQKQVNQGLQIFLFSCGQAVPEGFVAG